MKKVSIALILALLIVVSAVGVAFAQDTGYNVKYITSITYQNVNEPAKAGTVVFRFYNEKSGTSVDITRSIASGAGSSLFLGGLSGDEALPSNFLGSAVASSDVKVVATMVQIPQSDTVKNRPLSNGFSAGNSQVLLATILKNQFQQSSRFSIQNASNGAIDITIEFYAAGSNTPALTLNGADEQGIPAGAAKYYDAGTLAGLPDPFNGSAVVTAVEAGTTTPANIVGSVLEMQTASVGTRAFEGVNTGAQTVYMATALCNAFGGQTTNYAVQNVETSGSADVTVDYGGGISETKNVAAGGKASFNACQAGAPNGFSGAATITSSADLVVIGKVGGAGRFTAWVGEPSGAQKLALPYVRWTSQANFDSGARQRGNIAIQNIGSGPANITVTYLDKDGNTVGTHTINNVAQFAKANSNAAAATGDAARLAEFGYPEGNGGSGFGGSAIITSNQDVIAVVRIASTTPAGVVNEDYNGIPVE